MGRHEWLEAALAVIKASVLADIGETAAHAGRMAGGTLPATGLTVAAPAAHAESVSWAKPHIAPAGETMHQTGSRS